jgi:hypothetical protein
MSLSLPLTTLRFDESRIAASIYFLADLRKHRLVSPPATSEP